MGDLIIYTIRGVDSFGLGEHLSYLRYCSCWTQIRRIYGLPNTHKMSKPSAHSLTVFSRVLHHMLCFIFLPRGGHKDEVFYYEAFLIYFILTGRQIHLGYLMMMHMIACCESTTCVIPYGHFLTRVF